MKGLPYKPSPRYAEVLARVTCDHWEFSHRDTHQCYLKCLLNGATVSYAIHDGGNDINSARNMASDMEKACGCVIIGSRNRRRSRKAFRPSGFRLESAPDSAVGREIARLQTDWADIETVLAAALEEGIRPADAVHLLSRRQQIADRLTDLHQPLPPTSFPLVDAS